MRYRRVPGTDIELSEISFGCGDNAGLMVWGDYAEQRQVLELAVAQGINHFDTAPDYGRGRAEVNLGTHLKAMGVPVRITTKVEIFREHVDDVAARVVQSVEESLVRLGVDTIDFVQIHNPPGSKYAEWFSRWATLTEKQYAGENGAIEGLERLKSAGKILHGGLALEAAEPSPARQLIATGYFRTVNVRLNLTNPTAAIAEIPALDTTFRYDGIVNAASEAKCGVAVIRPLAGGALTKAGVEGGSRHRLAGGDLGKAVWKAEMEEERRRARLIAEAMSWSSDEIATQAYRFILTNPSVTTVIGGFSDASQLADAVAASNQGPLDDNVLEPLLALWRSNFQASPFAADAASFIQPGTELR